MGASRDPAPKCFGLLVRYSTGLRHGISYDSHGIGLSRPRDNPSAPTQHVSTSPPSHAAPPFTSKTTTRASAASPRQSNPAQYLTTSLNTPPIPLSDGPSTPSAFLSHQADGQSTALGPRARGCALDTTNSFPMQYFSDFHLHSFVVYLFLSLYKYLAPSLADGACNQGNRSRVFPLSCVLFSLPFAI